MPGEPEDELERERRIAAIEAELARQAQRNRLVLAVVAVLSALVLVLVVAYLAGTTEQPHDRSGRISQLALRTVSHG
jgi:hypothetical protein